MKRLFHTIPLLVLFALMAGFGCSDSPDTSDAALFPPTKGGTVAAVLKPVDSKETGTITGTVTFDSEPPVMAELAQAKGHGDQSHCVKGDIKDQTWVVDSATKGVANVVVWVDPPKGSYFPKPEKKTWEDAVSVDQPFCAFIPHVVVLYPETYDEASKALIPSGQKLIVKNSAPILHNIRVGGRDNPSRGGNVQPGTQQEFVLRKDRQELSLNCDIHKWMTGYAMTFDHPYAAVTDKNGKFTLKNVPAGSEITFMAWHESKRKFVPLADNKIKLNANETKTIDFKISK
jgi:hypothetical protein